MIWWKFIVIMLFAFGINFFYAKYVKKISEGNYLTAAIYGELVTLFISLNLIQIVQNQWYLIPVVIGGFMGTYLNQRFN